MATSPSIEHQIIALLAGDVTSLVREWTGKAEPADEDYKQMLTVSMEDVHKYVQSSGVPEVGWSARPGHGDGLYMTEYAGRYKVYYQERGVAFDEQAFATRMEAQHELANKLVEHSSMARYIRRGSTTDFGESRQE